MSAVLAELRCGVCGWVIGKVERVDGDLVAFAENGEIFVVDDSITLERPPQPITDDVTLLCYGHGLMEFTSRRIRTELRRPDRRPGRPAVVRGIATTNDPLVGRSEMP